MKIKISWLLVFMFIFTVTFSGFSKTAGATTILENSVVQSSFEAESASNDITGDVGIVGNDLASGKTIVNNINYQTSITFRNINVETTGTCKVTIYYISGQQRNFTISTNGGDPIIVTCPAVHENDWSSVGQIETELNLKAGKNDIKFSCDDTTKWGPNLDRIVIDAAATQDPPVYPTFTGNLYEAESAINTFDGTTVVDNVNAHDGKYVKVDNCPGLTFNKVHADEDGYYNLSVLYAAGDNNRLIYLTVNGVDVVKIKTPSTGYWDKIGKAQAVIFLNKGDNVLAFRNIDAGYPDIWAPYLDAITITPGAVGPTPVPIVGDSYEAEDAKLRNAATVQENPYSSGSKQVANLGGTNNGSVTFKEVKAVSDGNYTLSLFYVTDSSDASFRIKINDKSPMFLACVKTDINGKRGKKIDVNVTLNSGKNTIKIDNSVLASPQLDRIVVNKGNTTYEAEARINNSFETADITEATLASGGATIGNLGGNGSTNGAVMINGITVDKTGVYLLKIYYISGADRAFNVSINNLPAIRVNCPAVIANDWNAVGLVEIPVTLTEGLNTINFDNRTGYAPQLDKIEIGKLSEKQAPEKVKDNIINIVGGNVKIAYNLATGKADYYSHGVKKISSFYAAVKQTTREDMSLTSGLITSKMYSKHIAEIKGNETIITSTKVGYPTMKQHFTLKGGNYFLTQVELVGTNLSSNWMAPMMTDTTGGVDIGSYSDERALFVPYDNDAWTRYNAKPINCLNTSYEVSAFYDNTSRNGLVTGSVTHDTWKTGIYSSGSFNKLDKFYVYGGASTGSNKLAGGTHDVSVHGSITGNDIYSPDIFVGFYSDWRVGMDEFADANVAVVSKLDWAGKVPFGWNSWGKLQSNISYDKSIAVSNFIHDSLQNNNFNDDNVVYVNLDSYWDNMTDAQLKQFVDNCKANGQKAGIYWTPFVDWGNAENTLASPTSAYTYKDIWLRNSNGDPIYNNGSKVVDPTHPGTRDRMDYFVKRFTDAGFEFIKLDFLTHGSLEGIHYDKTVQTGTKAYNQGMAYLVQKLDGKMFISESIAPMFPYQYGHARRIACDAFGSINDSEYTLNASTYGWWTNGKLYQFNDPDEMVFEGYTPNENITRVNSAVVSGTVFLNGDDLSKEPGQTLAKNL